MTDRAYPDAALVLAGHGSTRNPDSTGPVYQHARQLRERGLFREVREAFWMVPPLLSDVWRGLQAERVFVVPLCISQGYFTTEVIPRALGLPTPAGASPTSWTAHEGRLVRYCEPVGTHPSMTQALLARAHDIVRRFPGPTPVEARDIALLIAGHGTSRNDRSREAVEDQARRIRALGRYPEVRAVYMEEEPRIADCWHIASADHLVMVPFFISDGLHTVEDIPVLLGELESVVRARRLAGEPTWCNPTRHAGKQLWYTAAIGSEPHLVDVILERVAEADGRP